MVSLAQRPVQSVLHTLRVEVEHCALETFDRSTIERKKLRSMVSLSFKLMHGRCLDFHVLVAS